MTKRRKKWGTVHAVTTCVNVRRVPTSVRSQFKAYCARRGYTMGGALVALMRKAIHEDTKLPEARPKAPAPPARTCPHGVTDDFCEQCTG